MNKAEQQDIIKLMEILSNFECKVFQQIQIRDVLVILQLPASSIGRLLLLVLEIESVDILDESPFVKTKTSDYKERTSFDDEYELPTKTSKWGEIELEYFNVEFEKMPLLENSDMSVENLPSEYKEIFPNNWDEDEIKSNDITTLNIKARSVVERLREVIGIEKKDTNKEVRVDGFVNSLFNKIGLNDHPYRLFIKYECTTSIKEKDIMSIPDFTVIKDNHIMLVIEDKHDFSATMRNGWGEYQVIGTFFTFYKAEISIEYICEIYKSRPKNNFIVERYPPENKLNNINALDFCKAEDRAKILNAIYYLTHQP
ncbi:hypothetical protein CONCODRAFT_165639 [Conidiobolus coronatus NRRL 28638]|uniref:Uncharacterized protein n=1 Tax=Conidiobolus coronatus (strain ATCC 28846 / CBS 209.66 / NRRL 28638) TaxID=796925 RepID=A0A137P3S6_CONC2|nr:hypothetical protein CONCODRAFT_165639 [Conidiobolus coronatus NRRL 28638]|eukprot:KXN69571.1 hypothetical protein CONCODRAFT_165639 [Conidiobolus coronatus NRRL 28638]